MRKIKNIIILILAVIFSSCCGTGESSESCRDDYGTLNFVISNSESGLVGKNTAFFIRNIDNKIDSIPIIFTVYSSGAKYYTYSFDEEPNFSVTRLPKNTYIYSIPALRKQDTLTDLTMDARVRECFSCGNNAGYETVAHYLSYKKNHVDIIDLPGDFFIIK